MLWRYRPHVPALALFPQPLVASGVVYPLTLDGHLFALRESTGSLVWSRELHITNLLPSLLVASGVIYAEAFDGNNVVAIRASTGSVLWSYQSRTEGLVSMTVTQSVIYLAFSGEPGPIGSITALRASDGSVLWHYSTPISATQLLPMLTDNLVLIALQNGNITTLSVSSGALRWPPPWPHLRFFALAQDDMSQAVFLRPDMAGAVFMACYTPYHSVPGCSTFFLYVSLFF